MKTKRMAIERRFDYATGCITSYRAFELERRGEWSPVARDWAEDQVCRGQATYVDVGRNGPITSSREG